MFIRIMAMLLLAAAAVAFAAPARAQAPGEEEAVQGEHSSAEGEHGATPNPLSIDPDLAIVTVLVFLLLLAVLRKFAWKPIITGLDKREHHVAEQLDEAERRNREAEEMLQKYQAQLSAASDQVKQMLEEARKSADAHREQEMARTQEAVKRERERAVAEIDAATGRALQEVANRAADTAITLAGRIVRRELKKDDHAALVAQAIDQFPGGNHR
jgi:F-type H+-transporting ATPase subunit b